MAVVCMASDSNTTRLVSFPPLNYDQFDITQTNWALAIGTALATVPFSEVYSRFGAKYPFFGACVLSALATVAIPFGAEAGFAWLLFLRFLQGIAFAADFASVGLVCSKWSTLKQSGLFISLVTCYAPLSVGFTNVMSGYVCDSSFGWPMVYYIHAAIGVVAAFLWLVYYKDTPAKSIRVSAKELQKIQKGRADKELSYNETTPYLRLLRDPIIWSIWCNGCIEVFATNFLSVYAALYMRYALGYSVELTGFYSGISKSMQMPTRILVGLFGHKISCISERQRVVLYNSIALIGGGISMFLIPISAYSSAFLAVFFIGLVNFCTGVASCGFYHAAILYSRQHCHFVMAVILFSQCANLFIGPLLTAVFVPVMEDMTQWAGIYIVSGILMVVCGLAFIKYSEIAPPPYLTEIKKITVEVPVDDSAKLKL
ncbi:unnamed protein product [Bursaphelenchus okinawaensis]|uniref:MFS domain-containing protein n=1 Tax=Bursaphelenchus okinawaensis TaxID=465554 RepID=A0A811LSX6_9BILA|nr:unnamed protein product [Bursaphelenchus okinawaensis]CAG9127572.1 unnamed protein product [Bursaphelenchus okinawaensis]